MFTRASQISVRKQNPRIKKNLQPAFKLPSRYPYPSFSAMKNILEHVAFPCLMRHGLITQSLFWLISGGLLANPTPCAWCGCVVSRSAPLEHKQGRLFGFSHITKQAKAALAGTGSISYVSTLSISWTKHRESQIRWSLQHLLWCVVCTRSEIISNSIIFFMQLMISNKTWDEIIGQLPNN
jgi:hypothetical protein